MTSRRRDALVALLVGSTLAGPACARAQEGQTLLVETSECAPDLGPAVTALLAVELSSESRAEIDEARARCLLLCDATSATAVVARGEQRFEQRIDRGDVALARRLAIALAELVEASRAPLLAPESGAPSAAADAPASESLAVRIRAGGGAWLGGEPLLALGGLELGVELAPTSNVAITLGAAGGLGAIDVAGGRLDARWIGGALSLRLGGALDLLWLGAGPALRGGLVSWTGHPDDATRAIGRDVLGAWCGVGVVAAAFVRLGALPVRVGVEIEGGGIAVSSEARALGASAARVGGGWLELRAVIDVTPTDP